MVDIEHTGICEAPLQVVFDYLDDYRNVTDWMFGLSELQPVTEQTSGVGAEFKGTFQVKPVRLSSTITITEWVRGERIAFESIKGFRNWSTWQFSDAGTDRTRIDVVFSYELPGGVAGRALGRVLEPIAALSVRHTDETLRREIAARYRSQQG
jgi:uncharacterized membrane protein